MLFRSIFLITTLIISQISYAGIYFCKVGNGILSILIQDDCYLLDAMAIDDNKLLFNIQVDFQYISSDFFTLPLNETIALQFMKALLSRDEKNKLDCVVFDKESSEKNCFFSYLIDIDSQACVIQECYHQGEEVTLQSTDIFMTDAFKMFRDIYRRNYQVQIATESISEIDRKIARLWCNPDFTDHDLYIKMAWENFKICNPQLFAVKKKTNKRKKRKNLTVNTQFQFLPMKRLRRKYGYYDYCIEPYSYIK